MYKLLTTGVDVPLTNGDVTKFWVLVALNTVGWGGFVSWIIYSVCANIGGIF